MYKLCFTFLLSIAFLKLLFFDNNQLYSIRCERGLVPMPDSIQGCVECLTDSNCDNGFICEVQWHKCIPKPDPCNPSPCGPGAFCMEDHTNNAVCRF